MAFCPTISMLVLDACFEQGGGIIFYLAAAVKDVGAVAGGGLSNNILLTNSWDRQITEDCLFRRMEAN